MKREDDNYHQFEKELTALYTISEKNKSKALFSADSLIKLFEKDLIKTNDPVDINKIGDLHYFKGETYYNNGNYKKALSEYTFETGKMNEICRACIYTKLNENDKALAELSEVEPGYYLYDFEFANYYEMIRKKDLALKKYKEIVASKHFGSYFFYNTVLSRIRELQKDDPEFLTSLYFPTGKPGFEISESDDKNRTKIFDTIYSFPEVKERMRLLEKQTNNKEHVTAFIYRDPEESNDNYYWIKVGEEQPDKFNTYFNFFVYRGNFNIKYYDTITHNSVPLEAWRQKLKPENH